MPHSRYTASIASALALLFTGAGTLLLTGCGMSTSSVATHSGVNLAALHSYGGNVHGGQQAVMNATVALWAAGVAGTYGTGATLVATTTTDGSGNFTFDNAVTGASPCTPGQHLYLTASGGDPGSGVNKYAALMASLPTVCGSTTAGTFVFINEVTTIAAVTALQQFMSINTSATVPYAGTGTAPWTIGAPSTNVTGLANAFLQSANLANASTGVSQAFVSAATIGGDTYNNTITPDSKKINGLANILSECVNDTTGGSMCSGSAGVLTLTTITNTTPSGNVVPQDTIQAAFNMATLPNPSLTSGSAPSYWANSSTSATYLSTLWANIGATPPFASYNAAAPADTAIDIGWHVVDTAAAASFSTYPSLALDGAGNVWYAYTGSSATAGEVAAYNQAGQMLFTPVTTTGAIVGGWDFSSYTGATTSYALGQAKQNPLAIDTNNNAWYAGFYTAPITNAANTNAGTSGTYEVPIVEITAASSTTPGSPSGYLGGLSVGALAIDGNNDLFFNNVPNSYSGAAAGSGRYYQSELVASGGYSTYYGGEGRTSSTYVLAQAVDQSSNYLTWALQNACANIQRNDTTIAAAGGTYPTSATLYDASQVTVATSAPTTCVFQGAIDANNNMWGVDGYLEYIVAPGTAADTTPTITQFAAGTGTTQGGMDAAAGVAIDGVGNIWVVNEVGTAAGGISEFSATIASNVPTITALSPAGTTAVPVYGFGSAYAFAKPTIPRIDSSGNIWLENLGNSSIFYMVGLAAPVVTPFSKQVSLTAIGKKP